MKKILMILTICAASTQAFADGFRCLSTDGNLKVAIYNQIQPDLGTRNAAMMVLSDPRVQSDRKTIATFSAKTGLLNSDELVYTAKVDLRFKGSNRKGEYLAGTRLGEIATIAVHPGFSYSTPVRHGDDLNAWMRIDKRNGDVIVQILECTRYLKN